MSSERADPSGFYGFFGTTKRASAQGDEEGTVKAFCIAQSLESIRELVKDETQPESPTNKQDSSTREHATDESSPLGLLRALLDRTLEVNFAQQELVTFTGFASTLLAARLAHDIVVKPTVKLGVVIEEDPTQAVYGLSREDLGTA
ncbi:MAG TPA: hypothetical protein VNG33_19840 [Polyangiaceae bacterium]|nr:hypothetical protein [Polyangiaceae bacterium]